MTNSRQHQYCTNININISHQKRKILLKVFVVPDLLTNTYIYFLCYTFQHLFTRVQIQHNKKTTKLLNLLYDMIVLLESTN